MTLEKAIKIQEDKDGSYARASYEECVDAKKLGIEAMKHLIGARRHPSSYIACLLPGETEE